MEDRAAGVRRWSMGVPDGSRPQVAGGPEMVSFQSPGALDIREASARLLGERIDTRNLREAASAAHLEDEAAGMLIAFRFGVVVVFGAGAELDCAVPDWLRNHVIDPTAFPETETAVISIRNDVEEQVDAAGHVVLQEATEERLLLVATVLARSVVLARDELRISDAFDHIEPLVAALRLHGRTGLSLRRVMQHIGDVLATQQRLVGRAQISEKPDILWDHPELDRLYARLEAEYELGERASMIERKLEVVGEAADVLLNLAQDKRTVRLELAIIALITFEIILSLYDRLS